MAAEDQSIKALFSDLVGDISRLIRQELQLARAEASESVSDVQSGLLAIVAGMLISLAALIVLLQALVIALANVVPASIAALLVGIFVAGIALVLIMQGQSKLKAASLVPHRIVETLKSDKHTIAEKTE